MNEVDDDKKSKGFSGLSGLSSGRTGAMGSGKGSDQLSIPQAWQQPESNRPRNESSSSPAHTRTPEPVSKTAAGAWPKILTFSFVAAFLGGCIWFLEHEGSKHSKSTSSESAAVADLGAAGPRFSGTPVDQHQEPRDVAAFVIAQNANVRTGPSTGAVAVGTLPQFSEVVALGREGNWTSIRVNTFPPMEGYIASSLLHTGTMQSARELVCDVTNSQRPYSGEVLDQRYAGSHRISVTAGHEDALVKLRRGGETALAFYVRASETGTVETVPDGTFEVMFASGDGFSRKCLEFVSRMDVIGDPNPATFEITRDGYYQYSSVATYSLTRVTGGNMRPQNYSADAFRE